MTEVMVKRLQCFACGINIGPRYEESIPYKRGDKTLCGRCYGALKKQGYIQLDRERRLLPDGRVIKFLQEENEEMEAEE